jgi:hypothetical protein
MMHIRNEIKSEIVDRQRTSYGLRLLKKAKTHVYDLIARNGEAIDESAIYKQSPEK